MPYNIANTNAEENLENLTLNIPLDLRSLPCEGNSREKAMNNTQSCVHTRKRSDSFIATAKKNKKKRVLCLGRNETHMYIYGECHAVL